MTLGSRLLVAGIAGGVAGLALTAAGWPFWMVIPPLMLIGWLIAYI